MPRNEQVKRGNRAVIGNKKRNAPLHDVLRPGPTQTQRGPIARDAQPAPGWIYLFCDDPPMDLMTKLAPEPPVFDGGFEGWEIEPRPKADGMTIWRGNTPLSMTFGIVLDGFATQSTMESALRDLVRVARGGSDNEPGIIGQNGIPTRFSVEEWVIENLDFGDQIRRWPDMQLTRQFVTITLRQFIPPRFKGIRRGALYKPKRKTTIIRTTKKLNTPAKIAKKQDCKWTAIMYLNPKRIGKANQKLKVGIKLRVPVRKKPAHKKK